MVQSGFCKHWGFVIAVIAGATSGCLAVSPRNTVPVENVSASAIVVKAATNKKEIIVGEPFQYTLVIRGDFDKVPQVILPDLKPFSMVKNTQSKGLSQDGPITQVYFLFEYTLKPKQSGTFTIPPAQVLSQGKSYASESITLIVREPSPVQQPRKENTSEKTALQ